MARDYGKVGSGFWTGPTGRQLRSNRDAQVLSLYLVTCPLSNMIGLYYLPLQTIAYETGMSQKVALKALARASQVEFAHYDHEAEHVWVPEMAKHQVGEPLKEKDHRVTAIHREWIGMRKSPFFLRFHERYKTSYHLPDPRGFQGASKGLLQEHEQEQEQEQEHEQEQESKGLPSLDELDEFLTAWNATANTKKARMLTDNRRTTLKARLNDILWRTSWREAIAKFPLKCFEAGTWIPDIDWFLKPDTVMHILEGKYDWTKHDNRNGPSATRQGPGQKHDPGARAKDPRTGTF